jgi:hypothetical protein
MKRRDFLKTGAAGAAIILIPGMGFFSCTKNIIEPTIDPIKARFASPVNLPEEMGGFYVQFVEGRDYTPSGIDLNTWRLKLKQTVNGSVIKEAELSFDEIATRFASVEESFFQTFQCVGNTPAGYQMSNGYFSGVPLRLYLEDPQLLDVDWTQANRVYFRCFDGYHTNHKKGRIINDDPRPLYLAYKFDGVPFSDHRQGSLQHGYPVRLVVPEMLGMKSPKAIMEIEVSDRDEVDGFWESRPISSNNPNVNWADIPHMKINSRFYDPVNYQKIRRGGTYKISGVAFGGIDPQSGNPSPLSKMEIGIAEAPNRIDFGPITWHEANIKGRPTASDKPDYDNLGGNEFADALANANTNPWPAPFVWSLWELDLNIPNHEGDYRLFARATDSANNSQPLEETEPEEVRDGNNGQHSIIIQVD